MVKPIFTWIMIELSEYLNLNYPGEQFAILMDNASSHDLLTELPYDNLTFVMLPPNCTVKGIHFVVISTDAVRFFSSDILIGFIPT